MITIKTFKDGTELILFSADKKFTGYGHYQISVELMYRGQEKTFKATTTNMEAIDDSRKAGVESWEEAKIILYEAIQYQIEEAVQDWMNDVDYDLSQNLKI